MIGLEPGSVMRGFLQNRADSTALLLDDDLARKVIELGQVGFNGTAVELAQKIGWESDGKAVRSLAGQLRYLAPALQEQGLRIEFKRSNGRKVISIQCPSGAISAHEKQTIT